MKKNACKYFMNAPGGYLQYNLLCSQLRSKRDAEMVRPASKPAHSWKIAAVKAAKSAAVHSYSAASGLKMRPYPALPKATYYTADFCCHKV